VDISTSITGDLNEATRLLNDVTLLLCNP